jgi:sigma-E factor negative regulatory protein RseB
MPQLMGAEMRPLQGVGVALRRVVCTVAVLVPLAHAQSPSEAAASGVVDGREALGVLQRIHDAASKNNYQGTVVVSTGGTVASARIAHAVDGRQQIDRIDALDGQARHVVRQNDRVHTVWPERRLAMVEARDETSSFPALLQASPQGFAEHYVLKRQGPERVAGRDAQVMLVRPRDAHRLGYRLWADQASSLLLRVEVLGERGEVLESSAFSEVSVGTRPSLDTLLQPLRKLDGYKVVNPSVLPTKLEQEGWQVKVPAPGFVLVSCVKRPVDGLASVPVAVPEHRVQVMFSDGLSAVTLFIEPYHAERHARALNTAIGATQTVMRRQGEHWVTWMGDVPAATLRLFAEGLTRKN